MKIFRDDLRIYLQLRRHIEESILSRALAEGEMIPSLRTMARDYSLNPITVANAVGALVEEGILLKKRGLGVEVAPEARERIIRSRGESFITEILDDAISRARNLEIPRQTILERLNAIYGEEK